MSRQKAEARTSFVRHVDTSQLTLAGLRRRPAQMRGSQRVTDVLDACERLLVTRRFEDLTMEDIARAAEIQISSLYHFFLDKTAVVITVLERILAGEGAAFQFTSADAKTHFVDYLAALETRMIAVWRSHGTLLDLYFAFQRHPLVWKLTLEQRKRTATQVAIKLRELDPSLSARHALKQGRMVSMVMGVLIDNLIYLPAAAQRSLRSETYAMLCRYVEADVA